MNDDLNALADRLMERAARVDKSIEERSYLTIKHAESAESWSLTLRAAAAALRKSAGALVIDRAAIPDGLIERLTEFERACSIARSGLDDYRLHYINDNAQVTLGDVRALLRLLSGESR